MVLTKTGVKVTMIPYSRSRPMSSEDARESPPSQKVSSAGGFWKNKEVLSSQTPSASLSQTSDFQHESLLFTKPHLAEMEKIFQNEVNSTGALDMKAFVKAVKKILSHVTDEMLELLFLKVDTDCNGLVTWVRRAPPLPQQEYVDYVMSHFQGKEKMTRSQDRLRFHLPMRIIPLSHRCEIVKVKFLVQQLKKMGHFLTVTKDGILQFWSGSFSLTSSFRLYQIQPLHHQQMWVVDMACLHNMNLVAIASTDQKIEFFDISHQKCVRAFTFIDLDSCVLTMDYWSDCRRAVFCFGDTKGSVIIFTSDDVTNGLFNPQVLPRTSKWDHWTSVSTEKLLNEKSPMYRSYRLKALHPNWCQLVKFIPQLNVVASCSAIDKSSLVLTVLPSKAPESLKFSVLNLRKGILCFDYCPEKNVLVTGGYDPLIRLWNPFFSKKPLWLMKGHQTSVTHILVNSNNNSILLSISKDKNIRVWDMQDYECLQSFCGKLFALGHRPITSAYFHKDDNSLVCSTCSIGILKGYLETQGPGRAEAKTTTYSSPLCAVLYSKVFKQVVSGCLSGVVSVWEVVSGRRRMEFSVTGDQHVELTAMSLDESEGCLLTGLRDGTVKMWNHAAGECLLTFPNPDQMEISGIVHMNKVFYVTGWSKRITYFMFHKTKPVLLCYHWQTFHTEDVLSMARYQNQFLGTSSYNGDILFWNISMLKPIFNFNASRSPLPLLPKRVQDMANCETESHRLSKPYVEHKWAYKTPMQPLGSSARVTANTSLRRNLMSAPPVMRHLRDKEPAGPVPLQKPLSTGNLRPSRIPHGNRAVLGEAERRGELHKKLLLQSSASVEKIIFLQTRPRLPHTAALLSSCMDGYIYAWSIHGSGGLLGKFPVDIEDKGDVVVGAMATDENDWILVTGDCKGHIKIWDIKDYCTFTDKPPTHPGRINKFQFLIPERIQISLPNYTPLEEKKVVAGQTISLVPPKLLITWKGHLDSVADILYVDSFQLVLSAGQDRNVKAWKLSGDAIGTFGLNVWKRLQDAPMISDHELRQSLKEEGDRVDPAENAFHPQLQEERDLAEVLVYQQREQVALMALLNGKADTEAEAWARLQKITLTSPWAGERSPEDIENSWYKWESKGKQVRLRGHRERVEGSPWPSVPSLGPRPRLPQVSKVLGAVYQRKERSRSPRLLLTNVQFGWMKQQISPQIYQSLHFKELAPTQQPDFMMHKVLDQQGRLTLRGTMPNYTASTSAATASSPTSSSPSTSGSGFLELSVPASPQLQPFQALPQPCSAPVPSPPALSCPRYPGTSCRGQ
ncbi:EF-hand calcium-binding domain-containing protein 8 isoform X1 [Sus scrofa]|uniref:EF-hand calcium-binding domain-containing protein 8 isoform X1 n=1 Tax=Sus scrofa TaxID=9823 RepID=UPI000A2B613B|nr:EF-hand calcium-binding domain-containing protein 8 isoform X1 [Sus scrofa]